MIKWIKENIFFKTKFEKASKETAINRVLAIVWLTLLSLLYTKWGFIILILYILSHLIDEELTNKKFLKYFNKIGISILIIWIFYLIYLIFKNDGI